MDWVNSLKSRLIRWLIGPEHTVIHKQALSHYQRVWHYTPEEFAMFYQQQKRMEAVNKWMYEGAQNAFAKHVSMRERVGSLRQYIEYKNSKESRN